MSDTLPPPMQEPTGLPDLPQPAAEPAPPRLTLDTAPGNATQALYAAAIGPVGTARYLALFRRIEVAERLVPSWNWAAALCTVGWMLFRRMGAAALAYLGALAFLVLLAGLLIGLVFAGMPLAQGAVVLIAAALLWGVPGVLGDAWLHAHCRSRMDRALADSSDWHGAVELLAQQAVTRSRALWLAGAHGGVLAAGAGLYLALAWQPQADGMPADTQARTPQAAASAPVFAAVVVAPAASAPAVEASQPAPAVSAPGLAASVPSPAASAPALAASVAALGISVAASAPQGPASAVAPPPKASASRPGRGSPRPAAAAPRSPVEPARPAPPARHLLNVGLFAVEANAQAAHARLRAAGLPATMEALQTRNGPRTRVRAGPFASRAAADAAARRIRALGLEAQPVEPPARAAP